MSYNDVRMQNTACSRMVSKGRLHFSYFRKGVTTHSTIDSNDGRQETLTGSGTTQDFNKTSFIYERKAKFPNDCRTIETLLPKRRAKHLER